MLSIIFFSFSPSTSLIWDFIIRIWYMFKIDQLDQAFDSIIRDVREDMEGDDEYISVAVIEDTAYWVTNNTFYQADIVDGEIDKTTSRPVNVFEMSSSDLNKMLFILDNLQEG